MTDANDAPELPTMGVLGPAPKGATPEDYAAFCRAVEQIVHIVNHAPLLYQQTVIPSVMVSIALAQDNPTRALVEMTGTAAASLGQFLGLANRQPAGEG